MPMTPLPLTPVTVHPQANVYFEGKCVSHSVTLEDGSKKSVGVILPSTLIFTTVAPETMECVAGSCWHRLTDSTEWLHCGPGQSFQVPGNTSFEIRVEDIYHYICHFE